MKTKELETISIVETEKKEVKYNMNFAMLLTYARQHGGMITIKIGGYYCIFSVLPNTLPKDEPTPITTLSDDGYKERLKNPNC